MEGNFEWFLDNYKQIYSLCGECHVVIRDKRIIKLFDSEKEAIQWIESNGLLGKATTQYCNGNEDGYMCYDYTIIAT